MSTTQEEDAGVWPAYVAAVAGLVQSLLFVSAVMALTLLQVGMLAGRKVDEALASAMAWQPELRRSGPGMTQAEGRVSSQGTPVQEGQVDVRFAPEALRLDDPARERLRALLRQQQAQGMRQWRLSIETDVDDPLLRRAAYLRLMAARATFIEVGIDPQRLTLRLLPTTTEAERAGLFLRIVPSREEPVVPSTNSPLTDKPDASGAGR